MKILITGTAGFIGFHLANLLIKEGHEILGLDSINDYYDVRLKFNRLKTAGINPDKLIADKLANSSVYKNYHFIKSDLENKEAILKSFDYFRPHCVINLAAQAGVRYSLTHPEVYLKSNIDGFLNILEVCRKYPVEHLLYASSSSVYGLNKAMPFSVHQSVDHPVSLYAATKKANELMAHTYSHLYNIPTTGLRFFTVYGPWGRPDMALFIFTKSILEGKPIEVFNNGNMERDFISAIEKCTGKKAVMNMKPLQPGDVEKTWADVDDLVKDFDYKPSTSVEDGVQRFIDWYLDYYK